MNALLSGSKRRGSGETLIQLLSELWRPWSLTAGNREAADIAQALHATGADLTAGFQVSFPNTPALAARSLFQHRCGNPCHGALALVYRRSSGG